MSKQTKLPDGFTERSPEWHLEKFVEFTKLKQEINEPSPHLRIVGHMSRDMAMEDRLWLLGTYAATYCLPAGQVIWEYWTHYDVLANPVLLEKWLAKNWKGIITRTERRCVRTPAKMAECLISCAEWIENTFETLPDIEADNPYDYYDRVYDSVTGIRFFGRYISIRFIEGLKRFCGIPAELYDVRSVGGWSPKRCMMYLRPEHAEALQTDNAAGNRLMDTLVEELLVEVNKQTPVDTYVLAAMLCEYKGAFENRHQYVGQTIDQEPVLYDKTVAYWGGDMDTKMLWEARKALFPWQVLGEFDEDGSDEGDGRWHVYRIDVAKILRDYGYVWTDMVWNYVQSKDRLDNPVKWGE